jgi:multiple sugar transport system permease protein
MADISLTGPQDAALPGQSGAVGSSRTPVARVKRSWTEHGLVFCAPFLLVYAVFLVWPLIQGVRISLSDYNVAGINTRFIGVGNYAAAFQDPQVWASLWHTVEFTLISTPPLVLLGLVMALVAHNLRFVQWLWRLAYFAPFVLPSAVVALIWVWMFEPGFGLVDAWLKTDIGWLTDANWAMIAVVVATVWWTVGFNFLLYLAALQGIPQQLYEAAELDGASAWQRLRGITLPLLRRTTGLVVLLQLIASLKIFDQVYIMTAGGPDNSTRPILEYMFDTGFTGYRLGYASAMSYILFVLIVIVSLLQLRLNRSREEL